MISLRLLATLAVTLAIVLPNGAEAQLQPTLRTEIITEADNLRLGDFFEPAGEHATSVVAYAPQPGRRAVFDANWLARVAHRYGVEWRPSSRQDRTVVERLSTVVTSSDIANALQDELASHGYGEEYDLSLSNPQMQIHISPDLPATVYVIDLVVSPANDRVTAVVAAPAGDPHAKRYKVHGRIHAVVDVPVPGRAVRPGEVIREADLTWTKVRRNQLRDNFLSNPADLIGQTARIPLRAGQPVRKTEVHQPAMVKKGTNVSMIFQTASMVLSANGVAMASGVRDEVIPVRNNQSGLIVEAAIVGPGRVEARLAGRSATGGN